MYSLEERTKAVQLYIESGCSESIVIRTLGYPSYGRAAYVSECYANTIKKLIPYK